MKNSYMLLLGTKLMGVATGSNIANSRLSCGPYNQNNEPKDVKHEVVTTRDASHAKDEHKTYQ